MPMAWFRALPPCGAVAGAAAEAVGVKGRASAAAAAAAGPGGGADAHTDLLRLLGAHNTFVVSPLALSRVHADLDIGVSTRALSRPQSTLGSMRVPQSTPLSSLGTT